MWLEQRYAVRHLHIVANLLVPDLVGVPNHKYLFRGGPIVVFGVLMLE